MEVQSSNHKIKILIIIDNLNIGGAQEVIYNYAKFINHNMFELIICNLSKQGVYSQRFKELNIKVYDMNSSMYDIFVFFKLPKIVKNEQVDIIHSQFGKSHLIAPILGRIYNKKVILHNHSGLSVETLQPYLKKKIFVRIYLILIIYLLKWIDLGIGITIENTNEIIQFNPELKKSCVTLYNGINLLKFDDSLLNKISISKQMRAQYNIPDDIFIIGNISRLSKEKDHKTLINAIEELSKIRSDFLVLIIGKGDEDLYLKQLCNSKKINKFIIFLGEQNNIPNHLAMFDIFVLTSLKEPFGIVLLEAMAMDVPVVTTSSGGPKEIIQNNINGFTFNPRDHKSLALILKNMIQLGRNGKPIDESEYKKVLARFNIYKIVSELEQHYINVLKSKLN